MSDIQKQVYIVTKFDTVLSSDVIQSVFSSFQLAEEYIKELSSIDEQRHGLDDIIEEEKTEWLPGRVDYVFLRKNIKENRYYTIYIKEVYDQLKIGSLS
jgi:hypothetical protein